MPKTLIKAIFLVPLLALISAAHPATSASRTYDYNLPSQELSQALSRLAFQSETQVLFSAENVANKTSNPVVGSYTFEVALEKMLLGSGLSYRKDTRNTWLIGQSNLSNEDCGNGCQEDDDQFADEDDNVIEEFIVTARMREEQLQEAPVTVNVIKGDSLSPRRINDADDLASVFPNLSLKVASPINTGFSIRGVGTDNFHSNANPAVGFYMDEISLITPFTGEYPLFDIERVEIMRGPQNTLFGRNTTGGAVALISNKPVVGNPSNGYARITSGNNGRLEFEGALETGINEKASIRIAAQSQHQDALFENLSGDDLGGKRRESARLQLAWDYSKRAEFLFSVSVSNGGGSLPGRRAIGAFAANGLGRCALLGRGGVDRLFGGQTNCAANDPRSGELINVSTEEWNLVDQIGPSNTDIDFFGGSVRFNYLSENFQFSSITSYDETSVIMDTINASATPYQTFYAGNVGDWQVFSQDFRFTSVGTDSPRWIIGTHLAKENDFLATPLREIDLFEHVSHDQEVSVISYYGHVEFDLSERFAVSIGVRHTFDQKKSDSQVVIFEDPSVPVDQTLSIEERIAIAENIPACLQENCSRSFPLRQDSDALGATLLLDYTWSENLLLYAAYSRGFKFGGFNMRGSAFSESNNQASVKPEFLDSFEVGLKSSPWKKRLVVNASVFYYLWKDQQKFESNQVTGVAAFLNIPRSELVGAELEIRWRAMQTLYAELAAGWIDSELLDAGELQSVEEGIDLNLTPGFTLNALIGNDFRFGSNTMTLQIDAQYSSEKYAFLVDDPAGRIDETLFLNGRLFYSFGSKQEYKMTIFANNITEEKTCGDISRLGVLTNTIVCTPNYGGITYGASMELVF